MAKSERFAFLDVLRGIAVLWMIQVHVTNVFLDPSLRSGWFFTALNISNGFVAPAFIFCAGSGLWIAMSRKGQAFLSFDTPLWQYLKRLSYILFWGYVLHMPAWSLIEMTTMSYDKLLSGFQVDVLQTIVYSSLFVLVTFLVSRRLERSALILTIVTITIWFTTALFWSGSLLSTIPAPIRVMLSPPPTSPFPLIPWSAYLFAGFVTTHLFMRSNQKQRIARWMIIGGATLPFIIFMVRELESGLPWSDMWWAAAPGSQLFRVCGIALTWGVLYMMEERLRVSSLGTFLQKVGTESLFLYLSHLLIVYGQLPSVLSLIGIGPVGYGGVAIIWIGVTVPLLFVMYWWNWLKGAHPDKTRWILIVQVVWISLSLLLTPPGFTWEGLLSE